MDARLIDIGKLESNTGQIAGLPKNPRFIKDDRFKKLVKSIQDTPEMLEMRECLVVPNGKKFVVIAGNMRLKACNELGYTEIPCKVLDPNTPIEKLKAITIKDNVPFGEHDMEALANEWNLEELNNWGLDLEFDTKTVAGLTDEDAVPEAPVEPKTKLGDIYQLGNHRLMCGDSTNIQHVEKLMGGGMADMVFTDPPYGVSYTGGLQNSKDGLKGEAREMIKNDDIDLYEEAVTVASMVCNGPVFMFYVDTVPFGLYRGIESVGGEVVALLIWKKKGGYGALGASYKPNHEPCVLWKKKGAKLNFIGATNENRIWEEDKEGINKLHPTQKPVAIPERAIGNHKADIVLDMFGGSGSTMIACEKLGRHARLMELDPKYCDVIVKRWEEFTGQKAELIND